MEAATLSSPQRKYDAVPVQKSLSLPSYAKAGGEGIDHRIIFAALEQKEKVRRKSIIFKREKTARQNIFCLPIPSSAKCRETSFSSDTSCSSLEYQKPKAVSKPKKEEAKPSRNEITAVSEPSVAKTNQSEIKSNPSHHEVASTNGVVDQEQQQIQPKAAEYYRKGHRSPSDTLRPNLNSSDSMDRSSRSSNDSLSRKERLVAIKAKVEAAREKYGDTSSEDENRGGITRYNSDGVIHRTVKEVKSRSYRLEKRFRRRSQDEYAMRKANRKNNLSLCLSSVDDGINLELYNSPLNIFEEQQNLECKTDFCPSPNFLDFTKKNYFSDFPSKENMTRMVQTRIRQIEEEERKRRNSLDFRDKTKIPSRQNPQNTENASPFSTQRRNASDKTMSNANIERNISTSESFKSPSPIGRAPTPPPRSPKSMSFVNKAYMQHQNSYLNQDSRSLERKSLYKPNISATQCVDNGKTDTSSNGTKAITTTNDNSVERHKMKELFNARRKTCSYFDYSDNFAFKDLSSKPEISPDIPENRRCPGTNVSPSQSSPKSSNTKGYFSNNEISPALSEDPSRRLWRSKWEEKEKKQEFMFNSLESNKRTVSSSWMRSGTPQKTDSCFCHILTGDKSVCSCNHDVKNMNDNALPRNILGGSYSYFAQKREIQETLNRLSKSEVNISHSEQTKHKLHNLNFVDVYADTEIKDLNGTKKDNLQAENLSATANLDIAMEELEKVYRSLKFSSDILSEKNGESNLSLNDLNTDTSEASNLKRNADMSLKHCPAKENNINFYENKPYDVKPVFNRGHEEHCKFPAYPSISASTPSKSPDSENVCIDELFNDLTRQLDIEQKFLKDSRDNRNENRSISFQNDKCDKHESKRMGSLESIVSIRKELYNNLQKNSQEQMRSSNTVAQSLNSQIQKHCKAAISLSKNISYLMRSVNSDPLFSKIQFENSESSSYDIDISPKPYEHITTKPSQIETKKEVPLQQPVVPKRTHISDRLKKQVEEIRQIRVSMDSDISEAKPMTKLQFPRLSSAVSKPHVSSKTEFQRLPPSNIPKEPVDVLDENGLEKLLNTLLNDVPDTKQSSLLLSNGNPPSTPPPASSSGKCDHVKYKRNILSKMDSYMAAATKNQVSECSQRLKSEEVAQVKKDFRQTNAHLNQMSFIPVYSNKTVCHKFPTSSEIPCENQLEKKALMTYSPPSRPRYTAGNNDITTRFSKTHMRRRSVGFEDMTSLSSCYGHNFSNDRRFQGSVHNSNVSQSFTENHSVNFNSGNIQSLGKGSLSENSEFSSFNHNAQLSSGENANDTLQCRTEIPLQRHKDKSSKRKSSLNRIDFIKFPSSNTGNLQSNSESQQRQNSSSDECNETRLHLKKSESPSSTAKRKHSASNFSNTVSKPEVKTNETILNNSSATKFKSNLLPKSSQTGHSSPRPHRWRQSATIRFSQKLSHSAGELELLTELSEVPNMNKTCFSAQEYDDLERPKILNANPAGAISRNRIRKLSPQHLNKNEDNLTVKTNCDNTSQIEVRIEANDAEHHVLSAAKVLTSLKLDDENPQSVDQKEITSIETCSEEFSTICNPSNSDCDDLKVYNDTEVHSCALNLEITENDSKNSDIYLSADETGDFGNSDGERRPSSILRKKSFEEKKELHSILKTPADDKLSKAPPSILKHRESSEEKETWQQPNDLHSILKKSTSEDESYNSGPDIRPILKLSTDEDSSSGAVRPRPILKKRTSFNDECSYVSFPCGELKPILKKKTPLSSEEQPKPILKSRRKSEDTRSTMSEVITSRPRAYSADMGVKISHEGRVENSEVKSDFHKLNSHNL